MPRARSRRRRYGTGAKRTVKKVMREYKRGKLKSGKGRHPKVKSRKQAIAIGLSEARRVGEKVPPRRRGTKRSRR
ncbi:MAG TPA: DUF6496 domain-containing protein [Candidatus Paceibacterota bacterium]|nr:DUF6496 domain-containing protein [Candidatus Paceibacterota bacterium]